MGLALFGRPFVQRWRRDDGDKIVIVIGSGNGGERRRSRGRGRGNRGVRLLCRLHRLVQLAFQKEKIDFGHRTRFSKLVKVFDAFPGATIHEKVVAYVKSVGFTDADIAKFRELMLEP